MLRTHMSLQLGTGRLTQFTHCIVPVAFPHERVADQEPRLPAACQHLENIGSQIASPGEGQYSAFEVRFLLDMQL